MTHQSACCRYVYNTYLQNIEKKLRYVKKRRRNPFYILGTIQFILVFILGIANLIFDVFVNFIFDNLDDMPMVCIFDIYLCFHSCVIYTCVTFFFSAIFEMFFSFLFQFFLFFFFANKLIYINPKYKILQTSKLKKTHMKI